jgi:hypothetical protein
MILLLKISGKKNLLKQKKNKTLSAQLHSIFQHLMDLRKAPRVQRGFRRHNNRAIQMPEMLSCHIFLKIFW